MSDREVHPVAALFPMLADDELDELAADIRERGLLHPIVLDGDGRVLDGRNRLAACERAEVEPDFVTYDGDDPDGYALAVNIARRHLSKGQRAMVMALAGYKNYTEAEISKQYVSWARTVAGHEDLVSQVIKTTMPLARAYEVARARNEASAERDSKLSRLREAAPDLADHVDGVRLDLDEALAALDAREEKARQEAEAAQREAEARASEEARQRREEEALRESARRAGITNLRSVLTYLVSASISPEDLAADYADVLDEFKQDDLDYAAATMTAIAALKET